MEFRTRFITLICSMGLMLSSCVTVPKIEGDMESKLNKLEAANMPFREIKIPWLAGAFNVVIPGSGQMYAGDPGDGVLTLLTFWLVYPYIMGIVDAVQEARVQNAKYTIAHYEKEGFKFTLRLFDQPSQTITKYSLLPGQLQSRTTPINYVF